MIPARIVMALALAAVAGAEAQGQAQADEQQAADESVPPDRASLVQLRASGWSQPAAAPASASEVATEAAPPAPSFEEALALQLASKVAKDDPEKAARFAALAEKLQTNTKAADTEAEKRERLHKIYKTKVTITPEALAEVQSKSTTLDRTFMTKGPPGPNDTDKKQDKRMEKIQGDATKLG